MADPNNPLLIFFQGALEASGTPIQSYLPVAWQRHRAEQAREDWAYLVAPLVVTLFRREGRWVLEVSLPAREWARLHG